MKGMGITGVVCNRVTDEYRVLMNIMLFNLGDGQQGK